MSTKKNQNQNLIHYSNPTEGISRQVLIRKSNGETIILEPYEKFTIENILVGKNNDAVYKTSYHGSFIKNINENETCINITLCSDFCTTNLYSI